MPIKRWAVNIALFAAISIMNNYAFSYNISVPMHIILRSAGSITTIAVGWMWGKRFSRIQVVSVLFLTVGVVMSAWSDAQNKAAQQAAQQAASGAETNKSNSVIDFSAGLLVLFIAMVLSAIMGIYTEETYREYGPQWKENLFYSHFLSLPLFIPLAPQIWRQYLELAASEPLQLPWQPSMAKLEGLPDGLKSGIEGLYIPSQLAYLAVNVVTQYACIRGVNLLASASSALTVTIVLNVRKLVSLLLSIWLFGNELSKGVLIGAIIVFGSGGMYSLDRGGRGGRKRAITVSGAQKESAAASNGKAG